MVNSANWMSSPMVKGKKLSEVVLPGSHDSGAFKLSQKWTPKLLTSKGEVPIGFATKIKFIKNWTLTQNHSIEEQLEHGIRLLDFRISYVDNWLTNDGFALTHTFGCTSFHNALAQVESFLESHPTEVIIIEAKDDYIHRKGTQNHHQEIMDIIKQHLKGKLATIEDYKNKTIEQLGGKVIFAYDIPEIDQQGLVTTPNPFYNYWPKSQSARYTDKMVQARIENEDYKAPDFVSYTITPNETFIALHIFSDLEAQSKRLTEPFQEFIYKVATERLLGNPQYEHLHGISLDYPTDPMIKSIVALNGDLID
ncbi:MAG: hypothetical protein K0Q51_1148 [Rickettsiaceae bacterium]|jgi:hypothetical protein|nr:hypothetical protein [Rickettsiaceae bacterium]